jgi:hypothetical protein
MRERVSIAPRNDWTGSHDHFRAVVTVKTRSGRTHRKEVNYRRMDEADLDAKFADLVTLRAGAAKARELAPALKGLDTAGDVSEVMRLLELPPARIADR